MKTQLKQYYTPQKYNDISYKMYAIEEQILTIVTVLIQIY